MNELCIAFFIEHQRKLEDIVCVEATVPSCLRNFTARTLFGVAAFTAKELGTHNSTNITA